MIQLHVTCDALDCEEVFFPEGPGRQQARYEAHAHEWATTRTRRHRIVDVCPDHATAIQVGVDVQFTALDPE